MIPSHTPPIHAAPNKLVKRSTSASKNSISASYGGPSTKIPVPTLKRPATSHKRSATLQERRAHAVPRAEDAFRRSLVGSPSEQDSTIQWRNYFTPKMIVGPSVLSKRRNSTGIPNPIKRVYADRKYTPVLLSARENVRKPSIEFVNDADDASEPIFNPRLISDAPPNNGSYSGSSNARPATVSVPASNRFSRASLDFQSAPYGPRIGERKSIEDALNDQHAEDCKIESASSSFSASDILPAEPQTWKQPPPIRAPLAKYRRPGARARSNTPTSMGNRQSLSNDDSGPSITPRGLVNIVHSPSSPPISSPLTEINLNIPSHNTQTLPSPHPAATPTSFTPTHRESNGHIPINNSSSPVSHTPISQPSHQAASHGETSSNPAGSDSEIPSRDEELTDSQSDVVYDSVRTKAPKSSPGRRGPPIESIFGESPPFHIHGKHTMLRDFLQTGPLHEQGYTLKPRHSVIHEEDAISTPARSARHQSSTDSPIFPQNELHAAKAISSSPPTMPSLSDLRQHADRFPDVTDDDEESSWSFAEDDEPSVPMKNRFAHLGITPDLLSPHGNCNSSSAATTPQRPTVRSTDRDTRSSIFDWSEQQPLDKSPSNRSPPRPKTVHGKKDAETRGSRSVGRRAPSGLHTRSQSVPVVQDVDGKRQGTNKFGTWGIGSKGVTEDWNEDFDFDDPDESAPEEKRLDSGVSMFVPKSIRDQQTNVLANINLLRDWGLLIEELKELKIRAVALELLNSDHQKTWNEVDAMIDLADQESDEQTLAPRFSPPSSPSFDYDAFDEPLPVRPSMDSLRPTPLVTLPESFPEADFDFFNDVAAVSPTRTDDGITITPATPRRPRKNSEAVARSVIEALQQKRMTSEPAPGTEGRDKVHFDTATLKRIIPYVQELRDRVKKVMRDAEDLLPSPGSQGGSIGSNAGRSVRRRLREAPESPTLHRRSRRSTVTIERAASEDCIHSPTEELNTRLRMLAIS